MKRLLVVVLALFAATASAQVVPMSGAGGSSSGSVPGGTITCGSAAQACTFNAPYTAGAADFNADVAATGGVDTGWQFDVLGDFGAADFTFKVRDNGGLNDVFKVGGIGSIWLGPATPADIGLQSLHFTNTGTAGVSLILNTAASGGVDIGLSVDILGDLAVTDTVFRVRDNTTTPLLTVTGTGTMSTAASITSGGSFQSSASGSFLFSTTRSNMSSSANGLVEFMNAAQTDFTRLNLGGTTEVFNAIYATAAVSSKAQGIIISPADGTPAVFADLGAATNGAMIYCSDCQPTTPFVTSTCIAAGTGSYAFRLNGGWKCQS